MSKKNTRKLTNNNLPANSPNVLADVEGRAAPGDTTWSLKGSGNKEDKLGIYSSLSSTKTETTVKVEIWYWTRYKVQDTNNEFYCDWDTYANTSLGSKSINHTSNNSWSTTNQTKIYSTSKVFKRGTSNTTVNYSAGVSGIDFVAHSNFFYKSITIPALDKYTITYNANGGTGAPGNQTVSHGQSITLSSIKPTREGAAFLGWHTNASSSTISHKPGNSYTFTANTTLYAIWKTNDYTVSYNANGGTNAPASQIKKHGTDITLSSQIPTRENYNFVGWGSSPTSMSPIYQPGDTYSANASITLYAIWVLGYTAPRITGLTADRCDSNGTENEEGTHAKVIFHWEADDYVNSIKIEWKSPTDSRWESTSVSPGYDNKGDVSEIITIDGGFDTEMEYNVRVTVRDSNGESQAETEVSSIAFELDFLGGGGGVSIGKPATKKGFEVNYPTTFENTVVDQYGANMVAGLAKEETSEDPNTTLEHSIVTSLNTPNKEKMYVVTYFHGRKSTNDNRVQCAYPYSGEDTEYVRHYEGGSWTNWKKVGGSSLTQEHFLTLENHKNVITVGNLRGGNIKNIHGVRYGNVVNLYVQINDITSGGGDVEIFRFKDSRYYPAMYGVHNGFVSKENNVCYIGQFNDGHFTMSISGAGTINSSSRAMVLITMTYITN